MTRFIDIDGVANFRDFGGYSSVGGKRVKSETLFRSGQFNSLSDIGRNQLAAFAPKAVIDLRKDNERARQPSQFGDLKIKKIENNMFAKSEPKIPAHLQFLKDNDPNSSMVENYMIEMSRELAFLQDHKLMFKAAFDALAQDDVPLVIHCTAGKDRTGTLCALILKALDVHDDDVKQDYLLTNQTPNLDEIIVNYAQKIAPIIGKEISPEIMRPLGIVSEKYLDAILGEIKLRHENVQNYLFDIGVKPSQIDNIKANLLI